MSHPSRPQAHGPAQRRRRNHPIEAIEALEERKLLAASTTTLALAGNGPVVTSGLNALLPTSLTLTPPPIPAGGAITNSDLGTITYTAPTTAIASTYPSAAPFTSVSQLAPASEFGGDIVRVKAGPGGVFGNGVYAISRGAGDNTGAVDRPGVIYRVDPATGKASVFFDLNSVISQLEPGTNPYGTGANAPAANSLGASTGLVNWYDIAFDPEGTFDGKPSMFVSSVDRSDPNKNVIYRIGPDGTFMGAFVQDTAGLSAQKFVINPTAIVVAPPEQQQFLHGLIAGSGGNSTLTPGAGIPPTTVPTGTTTTTAATGTVEIPTPGTFSALYFDSTQYSPGQQISSSSSGSVQFPTGVDSTQLTLGPQVGLTAANTDYISSEYSAFTDFGSPAAGGIPAEPGASGVQGLSGDLLIGNTILTAVNVGTFAGISPTIQTILPSDSAPALNTNFRRFEDITFDQYGYFSQAVDVNYAAVTTTNGQPTLATGTGTTTPVANAGNVFVSDLATGATIQVTPVKAPTIVGEPPVATPVPITVPVDTVGGLVSATYDYATGVYSVTVTGGTPLGGRIVRITPTGQVTTFAQGFDTNPAQDSSSFLGSELSISFSADGTTLYASDDQGIWQFKTTASLAGSTSGSLLGLNDLRSLGVPYDGQGSAVAIIDSGVDGSIPNFRGRVATGTNVITNGSGNTDTASLASTKTGAANNTGGNSNTTTGFAATSLLGEGHGTEIAGVVAQFVPQATIEPVNVFYPFQALATTANTNATTTGTGATGVSTAPATNGTATVNSVYDGLAYVAKHPFVNDPIRPGHTARVIDSVIGFGTTDTYASEGTAYKQYPQVVVTFKNQLKKFRSLGIAPIAAAGQLGSPLNSSFAANVNGSTTGGGTAGGTVAQSGGAENNSENSSVGDVNGMSLPANLNEVISVTGTYSFPFATGPNLAPTDPIGIASGDVGASVPILIAGPGIQVGGQSTSATTTNTNLNLSSPISQLTTADSRYFSDQLLGSDNRSLTTDFAAPAINIPTFRRRLLVTTTTTGGTNAQSGISTDFNDHNTFVEGGTSLSAAVVGGAYSMISSALNYWTQINLTGVTSDAYLTQPVGALTLNFGKGGLKDLSVYNNPDGINGIMAWTAVPVTDANNGLSESGPLYRIGTSNFRQYARLSVSDAIYSIQGTEAIQYLLAHNDFPIIDANHDGKITANELQNFEDNAAKMGLAEAGAMARLLGGTARIGTDVTEGQPVATTNGGANTIASSSDTPEQPDVLQREFNYFDYAADGQLNGFITIPQFQELAHTLLPNPTAYTITDRQRASANGFLLDPSAVRNFHDLQHIVPKFEFVPKSALTKYRNISPGQLKVNRLNVFNTPGSQGPFFTLYTGGSTSTGVQQTSPGQSTTAGQLSSTPTTTPTATTTPAPTPTSTAAVAATTTTPTSTTPTPTATTATTTPTSTTATTPTSTTATTPTATTATTPTSTATTTPASTTTPVANTNQSTDPATVAQANLAQANNVLQGVLGTSNSGSSQSTSGVGTVSTAGTLTPVPSSTSTVTITPAPSATTATTPTPTPTPTPTATDTKITVKVSKLLTTPAHTTTVAHTSSTSSNNLGKKIVDNFKSLWKDIKG